MTDDKKIEDRTRFIKEAVNQIWAQYGSCLVALGCEESEDRAFETIQKMINEITRLKEQIATAKKEVAKEILDEVIKETVGVINPNPAPNIPDENYQNGRLNYINGWNEAMEIAEKRINSVRKKWGIE